MKKMFAINGCVILIMILTAGALAKPAEDNQVVKKLVAERIEILNAYYTGLQDAEETENDLEKIEKGALLKSDRALMQAYTATELDQITDYRIKIKNCRSTGFGIITGNLEIRYSMYGLKGTYQQTQDYYFTGEKENGGVRLTQLNTDGNQENL